ncbi:tectonin 1 [Gigaspora margarita]|uniref:Tectonin 1 n=1 Tax=Gigaspora margarita TaxID=4874 RepID=A0A8H4ENE5_GIGMA|nr:tectonin 1 [Gigaspora margarita]
MVALAKFPLIIWKYHSGNWRQIDGAAVNVGVGTDGTVVGDKNHVWGVNRQNEIFYRTNGDVLWYLVTGDLKNVSVTADGTIYTSCASYIIGTTSTNEIYQYCRGSWFKYDGSLKYVSIIVDGIIWGVNSNDQIFTRQDGGFNGPAFK